MVHVGQRAELVLEAIDRGRLEALHRLERNARVSLAIERLVDNPHPALAETSDDLEAIGATKLHHPDGPPTRPLSGAIIAHAKKWSTRLGEQHERVSGSGAPARCSSGYQPLVNGEPRRSRRWNAVNQKLCQVYRHCRRAVAAAQ